MNEILKAQVQVIEQRRTDGMTLIEMNERRYRKALVALNIMLRSFGCKARIKKLNVLSQLTGRNIGSSKELSVAETFAILSMGNNPRLREDFILFIESVPGDENA